MKKNPNGFRETIKKILIPFCIVVGVSAVLSGLLVYFELAKINKAEAIDTIAPENEVFETDDNINYGPNLASLNPSEVVWPTASMPTSDQTVINILLIGQDRRPGQTRQRSDSMIILSYNQNDGSLKFISLMRDMYVPIPGYSDNRINAAYQFGGMELLDKTIETSFGITIDGNIEVDFEKFIQVVNLLGGLDITLNKAEAAYMNKNGWDLIAGENHLDGLQVLTYSRIRYIGNADYERTERQRLVLLKIFNVLKPLDLTVKLSTLDKMLPYLTTDMAKDEMLRYLYTLIMHGVISTASYRIPADDTYKAANIRGMAVLVPDLEKNRAFLQEYIYA